MIHELRVFHCVPGRLPDLLDRFENYTLRLFEKHGITQLGFWTVAIGESNNDLYLILQWESLAEREQKFGAFLNDPEWLERRRKSEENGPLEVSITNTILVPTMFSMLRENSFNAHNPSFERRLAQVWPSAEAPSRTW